MSRLVLWDVDHTLIENAGVSKEIYAKAFRILTGQPATHAAVTEGRTDQAIMARLIAAHGLPAFDWNEILAALESAGAGQQSALMDRGTVLPGVVNLIGVLARRQGVVQSIVTGNVRANAQVKLSALGLLRWFDLDVGAYGSDRADRYQLVILARQRAAEKYGSPYGESANAVVIGDTPRDVEAARRGGAKVLAVASGVHSVEELLAAGAAQVLPDLSNTQKALGLLL